MLKIYLPLLTLSLGFPLNSFAVGAEENKPETEDKKTSETVTVTAKRAYLEPSSNTVIGADELKTYKYTDLNRVLKTVPGVQVQEEDGFGLRPNIGMRGVAPHRSRKVLIMEDGIPGGPAPYSAPAAYYVLTPTLIDSIEVNKGSAAVKYGPQTIGGSINLKTKAIPEEPFVANIDLGIGSYNFRKSVLGIGGRTGKFSYLLLGSQIGSDGFKELPNGGDTGFQKRDLLGKWNYDLDENQKIFFTTAYSDELSDETYLGLSREDFDRDPYRRYAASEKDQMKTAHRSFSLGHAWNHQDLESKLTVYQRAFDRNWRRLDGFTDRGISIRDVLMNPVGVNQHPYAVLTGEDDSFSADDQLFLAVNHRRYESKGFMWEGSIKSDFGPEIKNELEMGARIHEDSIRHLHSAETFNMLSGRMVESGNPLIVGAQDKITAKAVSAHVWDTLTLDKWRLSAGLRQEFVQIEVDDYSLANADESNKRSATMPGAGVFYQITQGLGALAGIYRGLGLAAADDKGSGDAEESINYEAGLRWQDRGNRLEWISFYNDYTNIKGTCSVSEGCGNATADISYNGGEAEIYGTEFTVGSTPRLGTFLIPMSLEYTFTKATFQNNFVSQLSDWGLGLIRKGDPIPYIPRHQLGAQVGLSWDRLKISVQGKYQSHSYDQALAEGREKLPSSVIWDGSLSTFLFDNKEVYLTADNITRQKTLVSYRPFGARPGKPFSMVLGVRAEMN